MPMVCVTRRMGPAAVSYSDDFNRSNSGTLGTMSSGPAWQQAQASGQPGWEIVSNKASVTTGATSDFAFAYVDVLSGEQTVQATIGSTNCAPIFRASNPPDSYLLVGTSGLYQVSGSMQFPGYVLIGTYTGGATFSAGDVVKVVASGTSIEVFRNGSSIATFTTTANQDGTVVGFVNNGSASTTVTVDDFSVSTNP